MTFAINNFLTCKRIFINFYDKFYDQTIKSKIYYIGNLIEILGFRILPLFFILKLDFVLHRKVASELNNKMVKKYFL